ncbi:MAG: protein-glutamine gamma-glutamyltransferase [Clostridiales bacterium]|jgi:protein-glutamine gamma-glutamyltransferase|nr:protein-glutamine gamma-glutamyltransferase [Clostridiales bacterium]
MIKISGEPITMDSIISEYTGNSIERKSIEKLNTSSVVYEYSSIEQLKFEMKMRVNIIKSSYELFKSRMAFRVFRQTMCNEEYWNRTNDGGFELKEGVKPSEAIKDIFRNGLKYGTECATAIVIIYYKAVANIYPEELFNEMFSKIKLMNWHYDRDLGVDYYKNITDYLPGDCRYFKNPDVDTKTPQWQGENAIDLGDENYYGHGIGIRNAEGIIKALNSKRKEGARVEASLLESATRPDFKYLSDKYQKHISSMAREYYRISLHSVMGSF